MTECVICLNIYFEYINVFNGNLFVRKSISHVAYVVVFYLYLIEIELYLFFMLSDCSFCLFYVILWLLSNMFGLLVNIGYRVVSSS